MAYFVAFTILVLIISNVPFLLKLPIYQWGMWQWIMLVLNILLIFFFVLMVWFAIQGSKEKKAEKKALEDRQAAAKRRQAQMDYSDLDIVPDGSRRDTNDYEYYTQVEDGEVEYRDGKIVLHAEDGDEDDAASSGEPDAQ